ncbi:MAG: NAD(P)H-dependent oxidoreductase [Petrimonas sp.]|uniref:NAD(P)H-dependent oxidoreductase n=1 Tax=Petrimonas sp. TaxID=2023866 RepID=UPI002B3D7A73|nr:NAD(P)H-dependent oxidoreductase [Petrimonas sp.]MEA5046930.1 NAD(P)H-dependent oxidoreductase [Petrimonas sp.]
MNLIEALNWRYATKRMTGEKIAESDLNIILEAIRLTPTAYGLQPFKVAVTQNEDLIGEIYRKSCPQIVIKQCSHLLVFKARKKLDSEYLEGYLNEMKRRRNSTDEYIDGYRSRILRVIDNPQINKFSWMIRQTYIALGYATVAAATSGIDATPIEGFDVQSLNEILRLDTDKEEAVVMLALGYRDEKEDKLINLPKIRKPMDLMVERI